MDYEGIYQIYHRKRPLQLKDTKKTSGVRSVFIDILEESR